MTTRRLGMWGLLCAALLCGCNKDAINRDSKNTFLTADDLVRMTNDMAHSIVADSHVAAEMAGRPMVIVLKPIENQTNEFILPGEKELYVHRVRVLMSSKQELRERFVFVLNRADYERLQKEEGMGPEQLGQPEERVQPEYALTGTFWADTNLTNKTRSDTYLCTFRLTKISGANAGQQLWEGKYETSKHMKKGILD